MIAFAKKQSLGEWSLRVEESNGLETVSYNFYDEKHLHSRLTILITENDDGVVLDVLPF
jgi:hypothetical protein